MGGLLYQAFSLHVRRIARYGDDGLTVDAQAVFALVRRAGQSVKAMQAYYLTRWDKLGYKLGLQIRANQRIDRLVYRRAGRGEILMREDPDVSADLTNTFGASTQTRWVGFVPESAERRRYRFIEPNIIGFDMKLSIAPATGLRQLVPVAVRHRVGKFDDRYLSTLLVLAAPAPPSTR